MANRVVITGLGVISPVGTGLESFWNALINGVSGIGQVSRFDADAYSTRIAGEVRDFEPGNYLDRKEAKRMDRFAQFAVATSKMAINDAGLSLDNEDRDQIGVIIGSGIGGMGTYEEQCRILVEKGPNRVSPFFVPMMISNMASGQVSIFLGTRGPNTTVVTACASGTHAIGEAFKTIQRGGAEVMITGGTESAITPLTFAGFCSMRAMSTRNAEPQRASRPFDAQRDGFVLGEGCGIIILENLEHAVARGAKIYAEVTGYGASADAFHITAPAPEGVGAVLAMQRALNDGGVAPEEIDYINAHGTSTDLNDKLETTAIKTVFGKHAYQLAVSSTKSMTGHLLGAAGAVEIVAAALTVRDGIIPPTINYEDPDPDCDLDYVPNQSRKAAVKMVLSNSFGFGGQNGTLIIRKFTL